MVSRRTAITGGVGAAVLAALGYRAWDRGAFIGGKGPAFEAWRNWQGRPGEGVTRPLHAAILAASAHNSQPWLFEPHDDSLTVYADMSRNLGAADPIRRELFFSLGCALENLYLAAFAQGFVAKIDRADAPFALPIVSTIIPVAEVTFAPVRATFGSASGEPFETLRRLYHAIPLRHTNRGAYLPDKPVPDSFPIGRRNVEPPLPLIAAVTDKGARAELGAIIVEATERFIADPAMSQDSSRWTRTGRRDIEKTRDGVTVDTAGLSQAVTAMAKMLPDSTTGEADKYWLEATKNVQVPTAPAFGIYFLRDRFRLGQLIDGGMSWQRHHLMATAAGLAMQPMNAPIEIMDRDETWGRQPSYAKDLCKIAKIADGQAAEPAFIFRIGYPEKPAQPSPRRRLDDVVHRSGYG